MCQVQSDVLVDVSRYDFVEYADAGQGVQKGETKSGANSWFGSACDEKLDQWQLLDKSRQDGKDGRGWLIVDTFVQRINDDDTCDVFLGEWFDKEVFELGDEGGVSFSGVPLDDVEYAVSKVGITACKLVCESWKDIFQLPSIEVIPGTEEASSK